MASRLRRPLLRDHGVASQLLRLTIVGMVVAAEARRVGVLLDLGASLVVHFSYFTTQASVLSVLVAIWMVAQPATHRPAWFDWLRAATTAWVLLAGVTYVTVLEPGSFLNPAEPFQSIVQHQLVPFVMVLDWALTPGRTRVRRRFAWTWLIYPAVYAIVAVIIAQQIGAWLYPFLNPVAADGWLGVAVQTTGVLGILMALVVLVALLGPPGSGPATRMRLRDAGAATPPEDQGAVAQGPARDERERDAERNAPSAAR
ncbi:MULTISPECIES: Pr6Pr family membrane protein [unclassified Agrococcus]|uniref:Pr6Pr family membrane protein n=1 Tax=unclassified Agrococcus TaxID=2615065 RepID=UPI0036223B24